MSRTTIAYPHQLEALQTRFGALGIRKLALHLPDTIAASDGSVQCLIGHETGAGDPAGSHTEGPAQGCVHRGRRLTATT